MKITSLQVLKRSETGNATETLYRRMARAGVIALRVCYYVHNYVEMQTAIIIMCVQFKFELRS